jgi:hypothetical protein
MVSSKAPTVTDYLKELPAERRPVVAAVRRVIRMNLPKGFVEAMNWGMIAYEVPLSRFPDTYNGQPLMLAALAAQKNNFAVYLPGVYGNKAREKLLREAYAGLGKQADMGKSCLRFKSLAEIPLPAIGQIIASISVDELIARHDESRARSR